MEIDVEPVEDIDESAVPEGVDAPEFVLYGGKGGVGKTTMAAATALASARDGTATLVVSTDPAHSLSDTLETDVPAEPAQVREDIPLFAAEIDPEAALEGGPLGEESALQGVLGSGVTSLGGSMPGADEAAAVRLLIEHFEDPRFDRVVVDTAPTGHTLRLLELPEVLDSLAGKLLSVRERVGGLFDNLGDALGRGDEESADESALGEAKLEEFAARIERLRGALQDPTRTDFRVVMVPEEMSVRESERLLDRLDAFGIPVGTVVVNRVLQDPSEVADVEGFVAPNHTDCAFCERRWAVQQRALERAQDLFRGHEVRRVPLFAEEVRGERLLRAVAACLAA
jgi:arsenite-transporting ATPase